MNIEETRKKLGKDLSSVYKNRIDEVLTVLDESADYEVKVTKNVEYFKNILCSNPRIETKILDTNIRILNGDIILYPEIKLNGNFFIVLKVLSIKGKTGTEYIYKLIIFEKDWRLFTC